MQQVLTALNYSKQAIKPHGSDLRRVNNFDTPLKLIFYQNTYIATIFDKEHVVYLRSPQVLTSLPHFQCVVKTMRTSFINYMSSSS